MVNLTFKKAAYLVLKKEAKPLHSKDITKKAIKLGLVTEGKTPELTMNAVLIRDIQKHGLNSIFIKKGPSIFSLREKSDAKAKEKLLMESEFSAVHIAPLTTKQKGDIAEAEVYKLITVHGNESLSSYKPISDDEGIDLIVKNKENGKNIFIQIKSMWTKRQSYVTTIKKQKSLSLKNTFVVFLFFNTRTGEFWDYLWFVPAKEIINNCNLNSKTNRYAFVAGFTRNAKNTWDKYLIHKFELADEIEKVLK